jgi:hypothetical protein
MQLAYGAACAITKATFQLGTLSYHDCRMAVLLLSCVGPSSSPASRAPGMPRPPPRLWAIRRALATICSWKGVCIRSITHMSRELTQCFITMLLSGGAGR